jgi:agmatine/peptidylarginine deiminase
MNFLRIRDVLIIPTSGLSLDRPALGVFKDVHPGHVVEFVDRRAVTFEGGLLHCVMWQVRLSG